MTKQELLDALATKYTTVLTPVERGTEGTITHYAVPVFDKVGDVLVRQWVSFYVDGTTAYWQDREPKPTPPTPVVKFYDKVNTLIQEKIVAGIIKFGIITGMNDSIKKCMVSVVMADKSKKEAIVSEDAVGVLTIEVL